jgi:hypothetical protein
VPWRCRFASFALDMYLALLDLRPIMMTIDNTELIFYLSHEDYSFLWCIILMTLIMSLLKILSLYHGLVDTFPKHHKRTTTREVHLLSVAYFDSI